MGVGKKLSVMILIIPDSDYCKLYRLHTVVAKRKNATLSCLFFGLKAILAKTFIVGLIDFLDNGRRL